jgi:cytochrome b561
VSGWLMSSAKNYSVSWFNRFTWPDLIGKSDAAFQWLRGLHHALSYALLALASVHVFAALRHQLWLKDGVLMRMLPFGRYRNRP